MQIRYGPRLLRKDDDSSEGAPSLKEDDILLQLESDLWQSIHWRRMVEIAVNEHYSYGVVANIADDGRRTNLIFQCLPQDSYRLPNNNREHSKPYTRNRINQCTTVERSCALPMRIFGSTQSARRRRSVD